jgi:hypothetical protein
MKRITAGSLLNDSDSNAHSASESAGQAPSGQSTNLFSIHPAGVMGLWEGFGDGGVWDRSESGASPFGSGTIAVRS